MLSGSRGSSSPTRNDARRRLEDELIDKEWARALSNVTTLLGQNPDGAHLLLPQSSTS